MAADDTSWTSYKTEFESLENIDYQLSYNEDQFNMAFAVVPKDSQNDSGLQANAYDESYAKMHIYIERTGHYLKTDSFDSIENLSWHDCTDDDLQ